MTEGKAFFIGFISPALIYGLCMLTINLSDGEGISALGNIFFNIFLIFLAPFFIALFIGGKYGKTYEYMCFVGIAALFLVFLGAMFIISRFHPIDF